jgi:hypothetical protein
MNRAVWDFDYRPVGLAPHDDGFDEDLLLAASGPVDSVQLTSLLGGLSDQVRAQAVLERHPLYWTRLRFGVTVDRRACERRLREGGVPVRYLVSCRRGSQALPPQLDLAGCPPFQARAWPARRPSRPEERTTPGRWFVGRSGLDVQRTICGTGAGTRLAVIDNDAGDVEHLELDSQVPVGVEQVPRGSSHAAQLVAWAVGSAGGVLCPRFVGVAPDASPRLYAIAKPGDDVISLPLAIVRAAADGADVVLCATNVDGQWSPMLDDALALAAALGRGGRGTAVVMPCSRETSSPEGSVHPSLSLGAGEPAADPRVFCVAPSGRDGGWFLWRDRFGRLHPFANRGPALRWLAPGDDVALPFARSEIFAHAESSGASAMAAGVLLLVLGRNPELLLAELDDILTFTAGEVAPEVPPERSVLASRHDVQPVGRDRDGHNAKHGYGLLSATRACLQASDPVALALVTMGEDQAAAAWVELRRERPALASLHSRQLGCWCARALLADAGLRHAACALARTLRLLAIRPERLRHQTPGALLRHCATVLRALAGSRPAPVREPEVERELAALSARAATCTLDMDGAREIEERMCTVATALWPAVGSRPSLPERARESLPHAVKGLGA